MRFCNQSKAYPECIRKIPKPTLSIPKGSKLNGFTLIELLVVVAIVVGRAYLSTSGPPLRPWHTIVPEELSARAIEHEDWRGWIAAENTMFEDLHRRLQAAMDAGDRTPLNRYNDASRVAPMTYGRDWNRSYVLEPAGAAKARMAGYAGAVDPPKITPLKSISQDAEVRVSTGIGELDRVLGGGMVEGSVVLVGGGLFYYRLHNAKKPVTPVTAAVTRGDDQRARELREQLPAPRVGRALLVLDRGPLAMP